MTSSQLTPGTAAAQPPALAAKSSLGRWSWWIAGSAIAGLVALAALAFVGDGALLERMLAPLSFLQQPLLDLAAASKGEDAVDGAEYVAFLRDDKDVTALDGFFRSTPAVRFVSPGLLPGVAVVRIRGDVPTGVQALRNQPEVRMVLKSRLGMVCH
jgi:hypothetical protein